MPNVVPYNFVPLGNGKRKVTPVDPYDRNLLHGSISCTLKTVTPLFIPNTIGDAYFVDKNGNKEKHRIRVFFSRDILTEKPAKGDKGPACPIIPGSSIRGVLRSVYEAASNSCFRLVDKNDLKMVSKEYWPCSDGEADNGGLCPACSLFGMIGKGEGKSYGGRIRIRDTEKGKNKNITYKWVEIPGQFGPREIMYTKVTGIVRTHDGEKKEIRKIKGRKFYWHHKPDTNARYSSRGDTIQCIMSGAEFEFEIQFDGITEDELKQLVTVIRLFGRGMHKLGAAKSLGFGSVEMEVNKIVVRELGLDGTGILYNNTEVSDKYKNVTMQEAFGNQDNHLDDLMNILRFDAVSDQNIVYPPTHTGGFNAGNGQQFIRGSIHQIVQQIKDIREQIAREQAKREAEEQRRMQESATDEDRQRLAARFRRR